MFKLMPLPYKYSALMPLLNEDNVRTHYEKHHKGYVDKLNKLTRGTRFDGMSLDRVIIESANDASLRDIYNSASQVWNHNFFWISTCPLNVRPDTPHLTWAIKERYGSLRRMSEMMINTAQSVVGSGWLWLVIKSGRLDIVSTKNTDSMQISYDCLPLSVCDVWEHAYYLTHKNDRSAYVGGWCNHINWVLADRIFCRVMNLKYHYFHALRGLATRVRKL